MGRGMIRAIVKVSGVLAKVRTSGSASTEPK